jgi:hypothetical protein
VVWCWCETGCKIKPQIRPVVEPELAIIAVVLVSDQPPEGAIAGGSENDFDKPVPI